MRLGAQVREALIGEAGWKLQASVPVGWAILYPSASAGYDYDGDARTRLVSAGLTTLNGTFALPGYAPDRSWGSAQAGLTVQFTRAWTAFAAYQTRFSDSSQRYDTAQAGVKYSF